MTEFAIIDIGSNSIRYGEEREGRTPVKEIFTTRLGSGLAETGRLAEDTMQRSLEVLKALAARAERAGLTPRAYATSAMRDAENGREFAAKIENECGFKVDILTGEVEARYAFLGAVGGCSRYDAMLDIGGASMQVVTANSAVSFPAGCVRCGDIARSAMRLPNCDVMWQMQRMVVDGYIDGLFAPPEEKIASLVGVGGTITTLAALQAELTEFDAETVENVTLTRRDIELLIRKLASMGDEKRASHPLLSERHDVILYGAYILAHAMDRLKMKEIGVSCADGMEGYLQIVKDGRN